MNDLEALIESISLQNGLSPERAAILKDKLQKKPALAIALEQARAEAELETLFNGRPK